MRAFDLVRMEDVTGISGTGRVAEGCVFDDGCVVMRWLTAHRSTTIFPDIGTVRLIHGHDGRTQIVFRDGNELVEITKPHLALGNEGEYADASRYDQCGAGPVLKGAREAYDSLGMIEAPRGWSAGVCFSVGGAVSLTLRSPSTYLRARDLDVDSRKYVAKLYKREEVRVVIVPGTPLKQDLAHKHAMSDTVVRVSGEKFTAQWSEYEVIEGA